MSEGLKIRAAVDTENVKGLLLINGGAAVALLTFLPHVLDKPGYDSLARAILLAILFFQAGLIFAVTHNHLRRKCSLVYEKHLYRPPPGLVLGRKLSEPSVCRASIVFMWLSVVFFFIGGTIVFVGGLQSLNSKKSSEQRANGVQPAQPPTQPNAVPQKDAPGGAPPQNEHRYGAVIDAGSSKSSLAIFEWWIADGGDPDVRQIASVKGVGAHKCPLTHLKNHQTSICACLTDLTKQARVLAEESLGRPIPLSIPLWVKATAGVRSKKYEEQVTILERTDTCLVTPPGYEWKGAKVITGGEEGLYAWLAVNYFARKLRTNVVADTYGIVELGGQSAQIAYRIWSPMSPRPTRGEILSVPFASGELHVYAISDDLGKDLALDEQNLGQVDIDNNGCALNGDPDKCLSKINGFLCPAGSTGKNCLDLKPGLIPPPEMHFAGLSNFTHVVPNMGLKGDSTLEAVLVEANAICGSGTAKQTKRKWPDEKYRNDVCFDAFYTTQIAKYGWDIPLEKVSPPDSRWAGDPSWPLGAMIFEAARSTRAGPHR